MIEKIKICHESNRRALREKTVYLNKRGKMKMETMNLSNSQHKMASKKGS
jgi:hypothetical protein